MLIPKKCPKNIWMPISLDIFARNLGFFKFFLDILHKVRAYQNNYIQKVSQVANIKSLRF